MYLLPFLLFYLLIVNGFLQFVAHLSFLLDCVPSFGFTERFDSPHLIDVTYPTKMRWYKILAWILLMPSVIDFALAAPVVAQKHEIRASAVDAVKDGTATPPRRHDPSDNWTADAAYQTNALPVPRSSGSDHGWEQKRRQHTGPAVDQSQSPPPGPGSTTSPSLTSQAPTDRPDSLNPSTRSGNTDLNHPLYQARGPTDNSDDDSHALNPATPSDSRPLSQAGSTTEEPDSSSPNRAQGPTDDSDSNLDSYSRPNTLKYKSVSGLMQTPIHDTPPTGGSPQIASLSDESAQISSSPDRISSSTSWVPPNTQSGSSDSTTEALYPSSPEQLSTAESQLPTTGPTDDHPPPPPLSNPEPSTEPSPPPSAKRPRPEDHESESSLSKILKGKFKPRFSGSGALKAAQGNLDVTFNSRTYITAFSLPLPSTNGRSQ